MEDLKFDLYAMIHPKDRKDIDAMLDEAIAEMQYLNCNLEAALLAAEPAVRQHA